MIIVDSFEQGTLEWIQARLGSPGASGMHKIITSKGVPSKTRAAYLMDLAGEKVTGRPASNYTNPKMDLGNELEDESRKLYEFTQGVSITQVAMCYRDEDRRYHCSPDGLDLANLVGFETKDHSGTPRLQIERYDKPVPSTHWIQCQASLLVTGYEAWDYQSYCQGMAPHLIRVSRDEKFLAALKVQLDEFCRDLAALVDRLNGMLGQ